MGARQHSDFGLSGAVATTHSVRGQGRRTAAGAGTRSSARSGFTLVEIVIVIAVVCVTLIALSQALIAGMKLNGTNRETALATDGLRERVEVMQGVEDFSTVFARFNEDAGDDPVTGPSPGAHFDVAGLSPVADDPDGRVGEIAFPVLAGGLREDLVAPEFGLPRDLDGDGGLDSDDHRADYKLLPVLLRLRWKGAGSARSMEIRTYMADR